MSAPGETKPAPPAYGLNARLEGVSFEDATARVTDALKEQGFGVITTIDMKATLAAKLGVDRPPYVILGACNPTLANRALAIDPGVGLLLPCNVCVWEEPGAIVVSAIRPEAMFQAVNLPALQPVVDEVSTRLRAAMERVRK